MTRAKDISKILTDADLSGTLDVAGTVTAGGLTVDGSAVTSLTLNTNVNGSQIAFDDGTSGTQPWQVGVRNNGSNDFLIYQSGAENIDIFTNNALRQTISSGGDISFYEDTGTTPKLFWDASAEALGIGTTTPSANAIHAVGSSSMADGIILESQGAGDSEIEFRNTSSGNHTWAVGLDQSNSSAFGIGYANASGASLSADNVLTINTSGNVGIGTSSPSTKLEVSGASNSTATYIKPQGALPDNNDNAGLYVLHQGTAGTGLRVRTDNALTGSNFAHILVNNASASINAFQVSQYGSGLIAKFDKSGTTAMQIDNAGAVTKPLQPAFLVRPTSEQSNIAVSTVVTIAFGTEIFDQNADFTSNVFTAPVTGKYQFNLQIRLNNLDSASDYYRIEFPTSNRTFHQLIDPDFGQDTAFWTGTMSLLIDMDANDTCLVKITQGGGTQQTDIDANNGYTTFSGYLVA